MRILYVDIDTLRPDHLGCYGYPRATSTNIDKVAEDSVRFTDVYCSDAPCLPSRAALMTGRFGIHTGCVGHGGVNAEMRWEGRNRGMADFNGRYNLPAVLRRAGMKTASISSFPDRHAAWWFNGGFDETYNIGKRGLEPAHEVIPVALDWLDRKRDTKDWFLHVHVWDPHIPYRTPTEYGEPFKDAPLPDPWMTQEILDKHRATKPGGHSACEVTGYDNKPNPATPRQPVEIKNTVSHGFHYNLDLLPTLVDLLGGVPPFTCNPVVGNPNPVVYDGESYADCVRTGQDGGRDHLVVSQCAHVCQRSVRFGDYMYIRTYHDGYHLTPGEELFNVKEDPHEIHDLAEEKPELCWRAAWYLEHWVADNMLSNIYNYHEDPLWNVIAEGGPFHCRGYLKDYCKRLEDTGRGDCAEELRRRHKGELDE